MSVLSRRVSLKTIVLTLAGLGVLGIAILVAVVFFGAISVSARTPHWQITTALLHTTFKNSVAARADQVPPEDIDDPGRVVLGAQHYENVCSKCHGGPELGQNPIALSMRPRPQHLAAVVDQFTDSQLFYILENGVKFSAMPAWPTLKNDDEIWSTVAFLRQLPEMSGEEYAELVSPKGPAPVMPYGAPGELAETDVGVKAGPIEEYLYAAPATEWPDIAMTELPVARCAACHGRDGTGDVTNGYAPNLTIQNADYISSTLHAYAQGDRKSGIMQIIAAGLSEGQIEALGDYYANLPARAANASNMVSPDAVMRGEEIALNGLPETAIAPCVTCHESPQTEDGLVIPSLSGQSAKFIAHQLRMFRGDGRGVAGPYNPMPHEAHALTDEDITALAAYFASRPPGSAAPERDRAPVDLANAEGIVTRVCSECHTEAGIGSANGQVPNLTVHQSGYIEQQLRSFRLNERDNAQMHQAALRLEDRDIADLAAYFGGRPPLPTPGEGPDMSLAVDGQDIAMGGLPEHDVPACLTCHSADQTRAVPVIARLHGQNSAYLKNRLDYFAQGDGSDLPGLNPMHDIASAMEEGERAAVAAWFAAQEALPKSD